MPISISSSTSILQQDQQSKSIPVGFAVASIRRDLAMALLPGTTTGASIRLIQADLPPEGYRLYVSNGSLCIEANDDFGFIYGLYAFSRNVLGIQDLWFWNDQHLKPVDSIALSDDFTLESTPSVVRYRGLFINDEVLLEHWKVDNDSELPWQLAFETIYRLGGNMVIPGSGQRGEPHLDLAQQMGLYINQHHVCPLGARMFSSAYPDTPPRWPEERERFEHLWRQAIHDQTGQRTIWTLGFRGQGDTPFWQSDPRHTSDTDRGKVLSEVIDIQYRMVQKAVPGAPCVVYLYGEMMELYRKGVLTLPPQVTKIWSDNGYGRMVSRRQWNSDPRIPSMPDSHGNNGIYFHTSFYDLQAANHITASTNQPSAVIAELEHVLQSGGDQVWIINASNIKPHVYMIALIAAMWRRGSINPKVETQRYLTAYYHCRDTESLENLLNGYWRSAICFGPCWDQHAGEQYYNYQSRILITGFLHDRHAPCPQLRWLTDADNLSDQIDLIRSQVGPAASAYQRLDLQARQAALTMEQSGNNDGAKLLKDSIGLAISIHYHCSTACLTVCESLRAAIETDYARAFYLAGLARDEFRSADQAMHEREHGTWQGFWSNDCLTDVSESAQVCSQLMGYLRCMGDGPYFNGWKREFTYPRKERQVTVITNMEKHEDDDRIFTAMKALHFD